MPDLTPISNLVIEVLFGLVIWTVIFDPKNDTPRSKLVVYYAGVVFALSAGFIALLINAKSLGLF